MNIYVGNLPLEITEDELRLEFMAFGPVTAVSVMNDRYIGSGQPHGYGFVEMASKSQGEIAVVSLQGKTLRGRTITVVEALPLSNRNSSPVPAHEGSSRFTGRRRQRVFQSK